MGNKPSSEGTSWDWVVQNWVISPHKTFLVFPVQLLVPSPNRGPLAILEPFLDDATSTGFSFHSSSNAGTINSWLVQNKSFSWDLSVNLSSLLLDLSMHRVKHEQKTYHL